PRRALGLGLLSAVLRRLHLRLPSCPEVGEALGLLVARAEQRLVGVDLPALPGTTDAGAVPPLAATPSQRPVRRADSRRPPFGPALRAADLDDLADDRLALRSDGDDALLPAMTALVPAGLVQPDRSRAVEVAGPQGQHFTGAHAGQELQSH